MLISNTLTSHYIQTAAQQAFMGNIEHGFNACKAAHEGFKTVGTLPPLGSDAVSLFNYMYQSVEYYKIFENICIRLYVSLRSRTRR